MKEQREKVTLADAQKIIEKYEPDEQGQYLRTPRHFITKYNLYRY